MPTATTHQEEKLSAGEKGEQITATAFNAALGDEWTLIRGYRNHHGEIDQILLGPKGLLTLEIKHVNGIIHCDGDQRWRERLDKYGNRVEEGQAIADGRGRSPSQQLNESTEVLQQLLQSQGHAVTIRRIILFTHPRSMRGHCNQQTVHFITNSPKAVIEYMHSAPATLETTQMSQIKALITCDHQRPNARRRPRRASRAGT